MRQEGVKVVARAVVTLEVAVRGLSDGVVPFGAEEGVE